MDAGITPEQFELLLQLACQWAAAQEQRICSHGQALSDAQLADARLVGVAEPERVRLLYVPEIPIPERPALRAAADATQLISPLTGGLTHWGMAFSYVRIADLIERWSCTSSDTLLNMKRLGGFEPFLRQYLSQCLTIGYPEAPMEQRSHFT
jgi:hypothetical protein